MKGQGYASLPRKYPILKINNKCDANCSQMD